jgi:hypothetical protein
MRSTGESAVGLPRSTSVNWGTDSGRLLALRRGVRREPDVGKQFVELLCGMGREATEDVGEVGERVDAVVLARTGERIQNGRRPTPAVTPQESPIPSS